MVSVPFVPGAPDLLSLGAASTPLSPLRPRNEFHYYQTPDPDVFSWELIVRDLSHGLNRVWGDLLAGDDAGPDSHRLSSSSLYTAYPGQAVLPHATTDLSIANVGSPLSWVRENGDIVFGGGSTADAALGMYFASPPGVGNQYGFVTYTPGSTIQNLAYIVIGGATNSPRIAVCRSGASIDILTTPGSPGAIAASSAGAMHANLTNARGIITSGLNASNPGVPVHGIYANGGLWTIAASAAIGDAPTQTATFRDGGYPVDAIFLEGWPARAFWAVPDGVTTSYNRIVHTSLEFNDPQNLDGMPLPLGALHAMRHRNFLEVSDGNKNYEYDGKTWHDLGWVTDREPNTDVVYKNHGYLRLHDDLYCVSQRIDNVTSANSRVAVERFDREIRQWHQVGPAITPTSFVTVSDAPAWSFGTRTMPYPVGLGFPSVEESSELLLVMFNTIYSLFMPQAGYSDFNTYRQTSGAGASTGQLYTANGTARSVAMAFPPVPGGGRGVHVVEYVEPQGDVPAGGTSAYMQVQLATQTATGFSYSNNLKAQVLAADRVFREPTRFIDNTAYFNRFQYQMYLDRASNTRKTPNGLPIVFRGLTFARGKRPMSPRAFWASVSQSSGRKVL